MDTQPLLSLVRRHYPDWNGFDHPGFVKDEIEYKQAVVRKAAETLSSQELQRLLDEGRAGEVIPRVRDLAAATNLMYLSSVTGDLALLYDEPDPVSFVEALLDLLHGPGDSPQRLDRFVAWARQRDLPVRWPLLTYLLFFTHPDRDYFVKPGVTRWFLEAVGAQGVYRPEPAGDIYVRILDAVHELKNALAKFRPRDVVDIQSFIWVAYHGATATSGPRYWKIAPDSGARMWDECREGGFIAIGWEELGDVGQMSRKEFEERRDNLLVHHPGEKGWTRDGLDQVWKFAHEIREGDKIVANQGTSLVLGIGTVSGPYEFIPDAYYGHRLPVDWEDTRPRPVQEGNWRRTLLELNRERFERILAATPEPIVERQAFYPRAFELLAGLRKEPTRAFYLEHKDGFRNHVEVPFQETFRAAISGLPAPITELMETEESLFGRIPKNDYGRGGAWPYYWGALYPKGGQRIRDAQLSLWMNHARLRVGFYIGEYGSEQRALFVRNCAKHRDAIVHSLEDRLSDPRLVYGSREYYESPDAVPVKWQEWLADPGRYGLSIGVVYNASEVLTKSFEDLAADIAMAWELLFPLVLLAVHDEPWEPLLRYLGEVPPVANENPDYPIEECARKTSLDIELLRRWVAAIHRKKQAILYGPPGTGKTHLADQLARHLVGGGRGFFDLVQFHPSYSYEEFIQGIRPEARPDGGLDYPLKKGRFLEFCERASELGKEDYCVLIVDEINRANLSRVFGELMYLLEYREAEVPLASGRRFRVPENVRILGTMNTADRSIALVDHALRRRFAFLNLRPDFGILRRFHDGNGFPVERLVALLQRLNADIRDPHYEVGITFFLREDLASEIEDIWRMEIVPYLEEYFFDQPEKVESYRWERVQKDLQG